MTDDARMAEYEKRMREKAEREKAETEEREARDADKLRDAYLARTGRKEMKP